MVSSASLALNLWYFLVCGEKAVFLGFVARARPKSDPVSHHERDEFTQRNGPSDSESDEEAYSDHGEGFVDLGVEDDAGDGDTEDDDEWEEEDEDDEEGYEGMPGLESDEEQQPNQPETIALSPSPAASGPENANTAEDHD